MIHGISGHQITRAEESPGRRAAAFTKWPLPRQCLYLPRTQRRPLRHNKHPSHPGGGRRGGEEDRETAAGERYTAALLNYSSAHS